jgi:hypothetical protein
MSDACVDFPKDSLPNLGVLNIVLKAVRDYQRPSTIAEGRHITHVFVSSGAGGGLGVLLRAFALYAVPLRVLQATFNLETVQILPDLFPRLEYVAMIVSPKNVSD